MGEEHLIKIANYFIQTPQGEKFLKKINNLEGVKNKIKKPTPIIKEFTVEGRIYDKLTQQPIEGANIKIVLGKAENTKTNTKGEFKIKIKVPVLEDSNLILSQPILFYNKKGYVPNSQELLTLNREIKKSLPVLNLLNIKKSSEQELILIQNQIDDKIESLNNIILSIPEQVMVARRKSISKVISQLQTGLLPILLGLLVQFGITKINQFQQKVCPDLKNLEGIINKRNSVVKQLNTFSKSLILNITIAASFIIISKLFQSGKISISNIFLPLGAPISVGVPYTVVSKLQSLEETFSDLEKENKKINKQILISLVFLVATFVFILILLNQIDKLIFNCYGEVEGLEKIDPELQLLLENKTQKPLPTPIFVNGFELDVIYDDNAVGKIKRKYAVAKNKAGEILLKGEVSFSFSEQILIDELIFYIKTNNLKPF